MELSELGYNSCVLQPQLGLRKLMHEGYRDSPGDGSQNTVKTKVTCEAMNELRLANTLSIPQNIG